MGMIHKRTWTPYFEKILSGEKNSDIRLADFDIEEGDTIVFEEWNPDTGYTGRSVTKIVGKLFKVKITDFWLMKDIEEKGVYLIELSKNDKDMK